MDSETVERVKAALRPLLEDHAQCVIEALHGGPPLNPNDKLQALAQAAIAAVEAGRWQEVVLGPDCKIVFSGVTVRNHGVETFRFALPAPPKEVGE